MHSGTDSSAGTSNSSPSVESDVPKETLRSRKNDKSNENSSSSSVWDIQSPDASAEGLISSTAQTCVNNIDGATVNDATRNKESKERTAATLSSKTHSIFENITSEEIIEAICSSKRCYDEITSDLAPRIELEMQSAEESPQRRALYSQLELKRLDYCEIPGVDKFLYLHLHTKQKAAVAAKKNKSKLNDKRKQQSKLQDEDDEREEERDEDEQLLKNLETSELGREVLKVMQQFDYLRMKMEVRRKHAMIHFRVFHTVLTLVWCVAAMPLLYGGTLINAIVQFLARFALKTLRGGGANSRDNRKKETRLVGILETILEFQFEMFLQKQLCRGMLSSWGVTPYWEGLEHLRTASQSGAPAEANPAYSSTLSLFTHQSSYDAFVVGGGPLPLSMIGKKSLFFIPLLGQLAYLWGHTPIDRSNLQRAKESLRKALDYVLKTKRSFGIFPEGTRSVVGRPIDFKKGAFHTAIQAKELPITPVVLYGAGELWHAKGYMGSPGEIFVRVLPPIQIHPDETPVQLRQRVQRAVLEAYPAPISKSNAKQITNPLLDFVWLPAAYTLIFLLKKAIFA